MPDEADIANDQAERWLHQSLASRPRSEGLQPRGSCHYCETAFPKGTADADKKLFCDSECAKEHETLRARQRRR